MWGSRDVGKTSVYKDSGNHIKVQPGDIMCRTRVFIWTKGVCQTRSYICNTGLEFELKLQILCCFATSFIWHNIFGDKIHTKWIYRNTPIFWVGWNKIKGYVFIFHLKFITFRYIKQPSLISRQYFKQSPFREVRLPCYRHGTKPVITMKLLRDQTFLEGIQPVYYSSQVCSFKFIAHYDVSVFACSIKFARNFKIKLPCEKFYGPHVFQPQHF